MSGGTPTIKRFSALCPRLHARHRVAGRCASTAAAQEKAPPGDGYKEVSTLVALPDWLPGLGTLYVDPATLPAGPFLAYDHHGNLVSSIYMIPLKDMNAQKDFAAGTADLWGKVVTYKR